jgi:cell division protein FtsI (penicillin-binding protein 3)
MARPTSQQIKDYSRMRLVIVGCFFFLVLLALWARAGFLQIVRGPELAQMALRQHVSSEMEHAQRGEITDRNGLVMAKSVEFVGVYARPNEMRDIPEAAAIMAKILEEPAKNILKKLTANDHYVFIAHKIGDKPASKIKEASLPGVYLTEEYGRSYPNKHLAGQLLGFVGQDDEGQEGIELAFQPRLAGKKATFTVQRDASGRKMYLDDQGREIVTKGGDVKLTIDAQVQYFAEEALAKAVVENRGKAGVCLVVHVPSAEILGWANYPFFNPNSFDRKKPELWRNRLALDSIEPGSTMKPILIASALQENVVKQDTQFFCENGRWNYADTTIRDTHPYDTLTVNRILRYSSNIGAAKIGLLMGANRLHAYFEKVGFGERTGLPLPGEAKGILRPARQWAKIDLATASFGQGVGVTPLQLAQAYHVIASGGMLTPFKLVLEPGTERFATQAEHRVFDPKIALMVQQMMREVVEEEKGTGVKARIAGLDTGGKTGTAQKAGKRGGYVEKYLASFIGFIPAVNPEYLVMVLVDEPEPCHYGGVVAAPAVREVALKTMAYQGKMPETVKMAEHAQPQTPPAPQPAAKGSEKPVLRLAAHVQGESCPVPPPAKNAPPKEGAVPNLVGLPVRQAVGILAQKGHIPSLKGQGLMVTKQSPEPGSPWPDMENAPITLWLARQS